MTLSQIIALIVICVSIAALGAYAYWLGRRASKAAEAHDKRRIEGLEDAFGKLHRRHQNLLARFEQQDLASALHQKDYATLLTVAETLRIAADTWKAFKTGKKLERDARRQRNEILALAATLKPTRQEHAA